MDTEVEGVGDMLTTQEFHWIPLREDVRGQGVTVTYL